MPRLLRTLLLLTVVAAACSRGAAQQSGMAGDPSTGRASGFPVLDSARLIGDLTRLAHDSMAGRAAGTPENAQARAWLASEFRRIGLAPVGTSHEHPFTMARRAGADSVRGVNVLGMVRGTRTPDRVIVVSAHFDHVGTRNGEIYNGADDNASGTAAVLALAAHFQAHPTPSTLVFALWDAEEVGLLGARAFVATPPFPLTRIAANVNLDMVSRNDNGELYAAGASHYPQLRPILDGLVPDALVSLRLGHDTGGGSDDWTSQSDHGAFHAARIPFVYFGVEDHPDYHKPTDTAERIRPGFYYSAVRTIGEFVGRIAQ
jgi:hypothetical protein